MKLLTGFVLFIGFLLLSACNNRMKAPEGEINALLPQDTIGDIPRDYSKDVLRSDGQFTFNTLLATDLVLDLKLYDGSSMPSQQLTAAMVAANAQENIPINATVFLKNAASKKIFFAGRSDAKGHLAARIQIPAQTKDALLCIIKNQYNERNILIENITKYSKIERGAGILKSQNSVQSNTLQDTDGDLIPDFYDAFPTDAARAFRYSVPADDYFSVAFEDNFPQLGDGDYNDFLARYSVEHIANSANAIVEITGNALAIMRLAGYDHRFGIFINFPGNQATLHVTKKNHLGVITGTQTASTTDKANVVLFEHTQQAFTAGKGHETYFRIVFNHPAGAESIDAAPFDPYLYVHNTGYDVHLLGKPSLPNSHNPAGSDGFRDANGFPRGLLIPVNWPSPKEGNFIEIAYPKFLSWRQSLGQQNSDWFLFPVEAHTVSATNNFADRPSVTLPTGLNPAFLQLTVEGVTLPDKLGGSYVPIAKVYNVTMTNGQNNFSSEFARLEYSYNKAALDSAGLLEEFQVFYLDAADNKWKPTSKVIVDTSNQRVTAFTNHFTPFVLTAAPTSSGNVPAPPACISSDFPSGIGGSGNAKFSLIDENFKYYQDRNYFIETINLPSPENAATFADLGFEGAMGISTCNGQPPGSCGVQANHKLYAGTDYINFTAHMNLDVYVMYDTRGGGNRNNVSLDATWLTAKGFTVDIKGNGGTAPDYFVQTTDAVQYYAVYKKTYTQGQVVSLDGNRLGAGDPAINTNYWVIVKPAGNLLPNSATSLCVAAPDTNPPAKIANLQAIPGATNVTLRWQNPVDPDFAGVVIRRSTTAAPSDINEGVEAIPNTVFSPESFRDDNAIAATTYFYTVFALDTNNNRLLGESIMVVTGTDGDGDGLTDAYENATIYPTSLKTNPALPDTDGDGVSDGIEVANATDPTNPDNIKPTITTFTATSPATTSNPVVVFNLSATDNVNVVGYLITMTNTPPLSINTNWTALPLSHNLPPTPGAYTIYAWAKDVAGNVSNVFPPLTITLLSAPTPTISNIRNNGLLRSGFIVGTSNALDLVEVSFDSNTYSTAALLGSGSSQTWRIAIPLPASGLIWKDNSSHTIRVRGLKGSVYSGELQISFRKGVNNDVNGDGYADLAVGAKEVQRSNGVNGTGTSTGNVYVFHSAGNAGIISQNSNAANTTLAGNLSSGRFGQAVAFADVNGDGYADLAVGTETANSLQGAIYIFHSTGTSGITSMPYNPPVQLVAPNATILGGLPQGYFGYSIDMADVNGDGYADLGVGANGTNSYEGKVYIFHSQGIQGIASSHNSEEAAQSILVGSEITGHFGQFIAFADINGDSYADIAVGAQGVSGGNGSVYIFHSGGALGVASQNAAAAITILTGPVDVGAFGASLALADVNGDNYADLAVGAMGTGNNNGKAYIFHSQGSVGIASSTATAANSILTSGTIGFGTTLGFSDINGDNFSDLAVSSPARNNVLIFHSQGVSGIASQNESTATAILTGTLSSNFGKAIALADFNGDGYSDIAIGATGLCGSVHVFHSQGVSGIASQIDTTAITTLTGDTLCGDFGHTLSR